MKSDCLRLNKCCFCLNTAKGSILVGLACIVAALSMYVLIVVSLVKWDSLTNIIRTSYSSIDFAHQDSIELVLTVIWWGNILALNLAVFYIVLCNCLISAALRGKLTLMLPWISVTIIILPLFVITFVIQLSFGILGGAVFTIMFPAIVGLVWCFIWLYGLLCVISHHQVLKADKKLVEEEDLEAVVEL